MCSYEGTKAVGNTDKMCPNFILYSPVLSQVYWYHKYCLPLNSHNYNNNNNNNYDNVYGAVIMT